MSNVTWALAHLHTRNILLQLGGSCGVAVFLDAAADAAVTMLKSLREFHIHTKSPLESKRILSMLEAKFSCQVGDIAYTRSDAHLRTGNGLFINFYLNFPMFNILQEFGLI